MIYPTLLIVATALFAAISWRDVRHGLILLAAALPSYLLRFDIGPVPVTLLEAFALVLVATWAAKTRPNWKTVMPPGWLVPIVLLLLAATISVFVAPDTLSALGIWKAYFVEPVLVFLVAADLMRRNPEDRDRLFLGLGAGGLFVAVCAIAQSLTGWGLPAPWDVEGRVVSVFPYPNAVGLYLGPVIVVGVVKLWSDGVAEWRKKRFWVITTLAASVAIVLSQSEAAVVAVLAALLVAAVANKRTRRYAVAVATIAVVAVALSPFRQTVFDKLTFNDYSGQVRRSQWSETVAMLKDHAVFGAGLNGYPAAMEPYHQAEQYEIFQYPHTLVLNLWTELGLLGLIAFLVLAATVVRSYDPRLTTYSLPALLALTQMTVHALADVPYFKNDLAMMTWLLLAVVAASSYAKVHGKHV